MANIQIADLAQVENQFDELSDLELDVVGGFIYYTPSSIASYSWDKVAQDHYKNGKKRKS